jgi:hypothetical protein
MTKTDELLREFADRWGHLEYAPDADMYEELCALIKQVEEELMPSEEEIEKHFTTPHYHYEKGHYYKAPWEVEK